MTTETRETIAGFIARVGLKMTVTTAASNPHAENDSWSKKASHWLCSLSLGSALMPVPFSQGSAHRQWTKDAPRKMRYSGSWIASELADVRPGVRVQQKYFIKKTLHTEAMLRDLSEPAPPDLASVLSCLASAAAGYNNARKFEDWASEYGYDTDSRKAERIYRQVARLRDATRRLLAGDYDTFQQAER